MSMNFVTVKSAFDLIKKEEETLTGKRVKYVKLGEVSGLMNANKKVKTPNQGWTFKGNWKESVKPYFEGHR